MYEECMTKKCIKKSYLCHVSFDALTFHIFPLFLLDFVKTTDSRSVVKHLLFLCLVPPFPPSWSRCWFGASARTTSPLARMHFHGSPVRGSNMAQGI